MASYIIKADNSTLGPVGSVVTDDDLLAAGVNTELLVSSKIVEEQNTNKPKEISKES
jgi:hypothetical protein